MAHLWEIACCQRRCFLYKPVSAVWLWKQELSFDANMSNPTLKDWGCIAFRFVPEVRSCLDKFLTDVLEVPFFIMRTDQASQQNAPQLLTMTKKQRSKFRQFEWNPKVVSQRHQRPCICRLPTAWINRRGWKDDQHGVATSFDDWFAKFEGMWTSHGDLKWGQHINYMENHRIPWKIGK